MKSAFMVLIGLCVLSSTALGATIVQTMDIGPNTPEFSEVLTFDQFDDQGGALTLQSVEIAMTLYITGGFLGVDNDGQQPATVDVQLGACGGLSSDDIIFFPTSVAPTVCTSSIFNLSADDGDGPGNVDTSAPDGAVHTGGNASDSDSATLTNPGYLLEYIGTGTFDANAQVSQVLDFGGIGGVEGSFSAVTASGDVTVTYTYIPEPVTAGLLACGSILLAIRRRRR